MKHRSVPGEVTPIGSDRHRAGGRRLHRRRAQRCDRRRPAGRPGRDRRRRPGPRGRVRPQAGRHPARAPTSTRRCAGRASTPSSSARPTTPTRRSALAVAAAGKHLLVEKPLATTVADAQRLASAVRRGRPGAGRGAHPPLLRLRPGGQADHRRRRDRPSACWSGWPSSAAGSGPTGAPGSATPPAPAGTRCTTAYTCWTWPPGGSAGEPTERLRPRAQADRRGAAHLRLPGDGGDLRRRRDRGLRDEPGPPAGLAGASASCWSPAPTGIVEQGWDGESALVFDEAGTAALPAAGGNGFAAQLGAWLDAIGGAPPAMPVADAVRAVALGVAVEESIATGEPVGGGRMTRRAGRQRRHRHARTTRTPCTGPAFERHPAFELVDDPADEARGG